MKIKKITAIILAVTTVVSVLSVSAFATSEAKAEVPVKLTVVNDYKSVSVTVPASLPVAIYNGTVITADNVKITNNSESSSVKINSISLKNGSMNIGNYDSFNGNNMIALKINGVPSLKEGNININDRAFPTISPKESLHLKYFAKVSGNIASMTDKEVAKVVFTISVV